MIVDELTRAELYSRQGTSLRRAFEYLAGEDLLAVEPGRVDIDGDTIYAMLQRYTTRPADGALYEAHRLYLDVHLVLAGTETMYWAPTGTLQVAEAYADESDSEMRRAAADDTARGAVHLTAGTFAVVFPDDAHIPCCAWQSPAEVEKVVVKVRLE